MRLARRALLLLSVVFAVVLSTAAPVAAQPTTADLQVVKVESFDPIAPGATQTYTILLTNGGPNDAELVSLSDALPAGTTFLSLAAPGGWTCTTPAVGSGGTADCSTGSLAAFDTAVFTLQVVFDSGLADGTVVTNTAMAAAETPEASPGDESGSADTTVSTPTGADLTVVKTGAPDSVTPGGLLTYTITVINAGPDDATAVTLDDPLPAGTTFQSLSSPGGWICMTPTVGVNGPVSCSLAAFAPGSAVFTLVVQVDASATPGTTFVNTAFVASPTEDPNPENQISSAFTMVVAPPAPVIAATKTVTGQLQPGGSIVYTLVLTNTGPGDQGDNPGDELSDVLPPELTLVSAAATSGTAVATVATNTVTWNGALAAGASVTLTIQATIHPTVPFGTIISNQATLAFDADANGSNETPGVSDDPSVAGSADATTFALIAIAGIPALDNLGLALLASLLALGACYRLARSRAPVRSKAFTSSASTTVAARFEKR